MSYLDDLNSIVAPKKKPLFTGSSSMNTISPSNAEKIAKYNAEQVGYDKAAKDANSFGGILKNTVKAIPGATVDTGKDILQGIARTAAGVGTTAGNFPTQIANEVFNKPLLKTEAPLPFDQSIDTTGNKVSNALFGGKPINTVQKQVANTKEFLKPYIGDTGSSIASLPLVLGSIGLDLSGFGGKSGVKALGEIPELFFKNMAKEKSPQVIEDTLKKIGLDEANARALAPKFAGTKDINEAKTVLADHGLLKKLPGNTTINLKNLPPEPPGGGGTPQLRTPTLPAEVNLPKALVERQAMLEIQKDILDNHYLKPVEKYVQRKGEFKGQLPEVTGGKGRGLFRQRGDSILDQGPNPKDSEQIRADMEKYLEQKAAYKEEEASLKRDIAEYKKNSTLEGPPSTTPPSPGETVPQTSVVPSQSVPPIPEPPTAPVLAGAKAPILETPTPVLSKDSSYRDSIQQKILEARDAEKADMKYKVAEADPLEFPEETQMVRNVTNTLKTPEVAPKYKDIGLIKTQFRDIYRNSEQVFGKDFPAIDKAILQPLEDSKGNLIDFYNQEIANFKNSPAAKFKRGSKESAAIQEFGEGHITKDELINRFGKGKAQAIEDAVPFFREKYQNLIDRVNAVEMRIYPNNPAKWTPTLENYFRHGTMSQSGLAKLQSIYENPVRIDPNLVGLTEETKPLTKWQSFKQSRLLDKSSKPDAIGGFLDYLTNAGYAINIDPHVGKFRALADDLAVNTTDSKNLNNYILQVRKFADRLAGKSNDVDRAIGGVVGRTNLEAVNWLNNRVKANTVLANASSSLAQLGNIPQGIANAGIPNSIKALGKTLAQNFVENSAMKQSNFIKERFFKGFDQFDTGILNSPKKFGKWMITVLDEAGTKFIWNGQYEKGKSLGLKGEELIQYTDRNAKKLVAGRGIGDLSLIQSSKIMQLMAPFQVEVTNLWWAMEDLAKSDKNFAQKFGKFITLFASLYFLNNGLEKATGNRPLLDPVQATMDGIEAIQQESNATGVAKAGGRVAGEILGNIPFGQTLANYYPEFGGNFMGKQTPTRKEIFGRNDPTRYGSGLLVNKGIADPLFKVLPSFGGSQIKKSLQGPKAVSEGESRTTGGNLQYKIDKTAGNYLKAGLFGKSSLKEAQEYYDRKASNITYPESILNKLKNKEISKTEFIKMIKEDPALEKNITTTLKTQALNRTKDEEKISNLGVANNMRAQAIAKKYNKLKTKEEKKALILDYIKKKIITDDVAKQLPELLLK